MPERVVLLCLTPKENKPNDKKRDAIYMLKENG
jgi:hypothetical protein